MSRWDGESLYHTYATRFGCPRLSTGNRQAFVADLARQHGQRLRRFFASRFRAARSDLPDLVQEVYLRLLRVSRHESIRNPEAYLFTVARHVLYQHKLSAAVATQSLDVEEVLEDLDARGDGDDPSEDAEGSQRLELLGQVLDELPPKCRAAFVLYGRYGFTLGEVSAQLGVSRSMVKKYVATALAHCHMRLHELVKEASDGYRRTKI